MLVVGGNDLYLFEGTDASSTRMRSSNVKDSTICGQNNNEWNEKENHGHYYPIFLVFFAQEFSHRSSKRC